MILKIVMVLYAVSVSWICSELFSTAKDLDFKPRTTLLLRIGIILAMIGTLIVTIGVILEW